MVSKSTNRPGIGNTPAVPSRNALRLLRHLALAGSTVGSFCTVAAITYDMHRRVCVAERIVENKRALQTSAPNYDATAAARRLSRMMEAAEAGEFMGAETLREDNRRSHEAQQRPDDGSSSPSTTPPLPVDSQHLGFPMQPSEVMEPVQSEVPRPFGPMINPGSLPELRNTYLDPRWSSTDSIGSGSSATETEIRGLLIQNRPIDAGQVFLDAHPASLGGISSERKELAIRVFFVNCEEGNVYIARSIFTRLEELDAVSQMMWRALLFELAKKGAIESTAALYTRYRLKFSLPPQMVDIVLRCLLESHRLTTAKWVLLRNLHVDRDCGLCGAYLAGLWKKARSIELMNTQLKKLLMALAQCGKQPSEKLFNPVIQAYIDFGRFKDAEALVNDMTSIYDIQINCRTMGLLVYGKALQCDWEGVEEGLQQMCENKFNKRRRDFVIVFDRIFLEYWVSHSGLEIRDWIFGCIEKFGIVPDRVLYKHILEAFVEKGNAQMIAEVSRMAREQSWKTNVNEEEFLEMLRARRLALEDGPVGFWHMLQASRVRHGQAATSQHVLGFDQRSFPSPEVNKMPFTQAPMSWYIRSLQESTPSKSVDQYLKLHKQMAHYMHAGKMEDALKCFNSARTAGFKMKQVHSELAVIATLFQHGLKAAREAIDQEWSNIRELRFVRNYPQLFRMLDEVDDKAEAEQVKLAVLRFYYLCYYNKKMTVKHHITVAISRRLIYVKKSDVALNLLASVYLSRFRGMANFDSVCMKMFVRAFAELGSLAGIRWGILTALASQSRSVTWDFVVEIRRVLGVLQRDFNVSPSPDKTSKLGYLDYLANLIEKKSQGDVSAEELQAEHREKPPNQKSPAWSCDERTLFHKGKVRDALETWDKVDELEAVLGTMDSTVAAGGGMMRGSNTTLWQKMSVP